jgi:hypothetical protein
MNIQYIIKMCRSPSALDLHTTVLVRTLCVRVIDLSMLKPVGV